MIAFISAPGTFFISNDGFYFGVLPVLAEAGRSYGFDNMSMALASLMGQAFHLLSPLVAFIYLLLRLTGLDMVPMAKESAKYALGIFVIFVVTIVAFRSHAFIYSTKLNVVAETVGVPFLLGFHFVFSCVIFSFLILYLLSIKITYRRCLI